MRKLPFLLMLSFLGTLHAQTNALDLSVRMEAKVFENPARIQLDWRVGNGATGITLYRKTTQAISWGAPYVLLTLGDSTFVDSNVVVGQEYEYRLVKSGSPTGNGYLLAAIRKSEVGARGKILLVVDSLNAADVGVDAALFQTQSDLQNDGWEVSSLLVGETWPPARVKDSISDWYQQDPVNSKALYLLGRVPVAYSGDINPDGHPDHKGAWPTDLFYGDISGNPWTDATTNTVAASDPRNHNIPGDGKYDQNLIPSDVDLMVGRVDFRNLPLFSATEQQLLVRYLDKASRYKRGLLRAQDKALVDDNFNGYPEGFAASGHRTFAPLVGLDSVSQGSDFILGSSANGGTSHLWGYGCGPGSYNSCGGVGTSVDFAADSLQMVFSMLFGSYFGDWDNGSALLRSALAQGWTLTTAWAGRPHWVFHRMGLGYPIGHSAMLSQNNNGTFHASTLGSFARWIHNNFLGDPTLRIHYIAPPDFLTLTDSVGCKLAWTASTDPVEGYNIYRQHADSSIWVKLNGFPVAGLTYHDSSVVRPARYTYLVKAVELDSTASGTYFNESLGIRGELELLVGADPSMEAAWVVFPNPATDWVRVFASGQNCELQLTDLTGRVLGTYSLQNEAKIGVQGLPGGLYLLHASDASGLKKTLKFVKH